MNGLRAWLTGLFARGDDEGSRVRWERATDSLKRADQALKTQEQEREISRDQEDRIRLLEAQARRQRRSLR